MIFKILNKKAVYKILGKKNLIERKLRVKISVKGGRVSLEGKEFDLYVAEKVLEAIDKGFSVNIALLLTDENYILEEIPIKNFTRKKNLEEVKGRIIGTKGKTLKVISELANCHLALNENTVSIIGEAENIKEVVIAIENLIKGSKQANIYKFLERQRKKPPIESLGLK